MHDWHARITTTPAVSEDAVWDLLEQFPGRGPSAGLGAERTSLSLTAFGGTITDAAADVIAAVSATGQTVVKVELQSYEELEREFSRLHS